MPNNNKLNRYVLTEELYSLLKQQIMSHSMSAGDRINIDKMARELGVSNIPIREALFRLASEGFVNIVPFKGMFVAEMSLKDIDEIFEIRTQLEELSLRKALPNIPSERLEQILHSLTSQAAAGEGMDEEQVIARMNDDLHGTILSFADNGNLTRIVSSLIERIHRYLNLYHYKIDMGAERLEHASVVRALLDRDPERAVLAMRQHLQNSHARIRDSFE
jgi:Transcriptional regulators